jgi:hypothetical protein
VDEKETWSDRVLEDSAIPVDTRAVDPSSPNVGNDGYGIDRLST